MRAPHTLLDHIGKLAPDLGLVPQVVVQPGGPKLGGFPLPLLLHPVHKLQGRGRRAAGICWIAPPLLRGCQAGLLGKLPGSPPATPTCLFSATTYSLNCSTLLLIAAPGQAIYSWDWGTVALLLA